MKAIARRGTSLVAADIAEPVPGPGQVLVKSLASGICGSDLHALPHAERRVEIAARGGMPSSMDPSRDVVFGHEFCGEIVGFGPETTRRLPVGTRVVSLPYARGPGGWELVGYSNRFPGGFGERMVLTEDLLIPVPGDVSTLAATMTEPLAVGIHAVNEARVEQGDVCMVIGCGPVGLAVIAALRARGIRTIVGVDFSPGRRATAERVGATLVLDPAKGNPHAGWADWGVTTRKPDPTSDWDVAAMTNRATIFECVGVPGVLQGVFLGAPPFSKIVVVGVCMETDQLEPILAITKELSIRYVVGYTRSEFAEGLAGIADGRFDVTPFVTGTVGLDGVAEAFTALKDPETHVKIVVVPDQQAPGIMPVGARRVVA